MNAPKPAHPAFPALSNKTIAFPHRDQAAPTRKLERLVIIEGEIRNLPNRAAVGIHAVNEPRDLLEFGHACMFTVRGNGKLRVEAASSVAELDANAPLLRTLCRLVKGRSVAAKSALVDLSPASVEHEYPYKFGCVVQLPDRRGKVSGLLLFASAYAWQPANQQIAERLAGAYAHALGAFSPRFFSFGFALPRWMWIAGLLLVTGLSFVPVNLTVLAPFEVIAAAPAPVTAPIDGVIAAFAVEPNTQVSKGDPLFSFDATILRADEQVALQKKLVAQARLDTARNGAFGDSDFRNSIAVAEKEFELADSEHVFAQSMLARVQVLAPSDGTVLFSAKTDWLGKPVRVGEKIMDVADEHSVAYRVDLGVHDAIALQQGARAKIFLDADPLNPRAAAITEMSYHATAQADGQLAFRIIATPDKPGGMLRIGLRGTAQLSGEKVSLGFYILRRPIAALRQFTGF